jgi:hypothetical protein
MIERRTVLKSAGGMALGALFGAGLVRPAFGAAPTGGSFSAIDSALIADIADTIIPAGDTPGAKAAGVAQFVEHIVFDWYDAAERDDFLKGLAGFPQAVVRAKGKTFAKLSAADRLAVLSLLDAGGEADGAAQQASFVDRMKALTVYGYYTSEIGASQELNFNMVPGSYDHCAHIAPGEHAPALANTNPRLP